MKFDLYVWHAPRDLDAEAAEALINGWEETGGDPAKAPFEPSSNVGWLYRELMSDGPTLLAVSDAVPTQTRLPVWLSTDPEPPARVVAIGLTPQTTREELESILGLAMKYDLVIFDARNRRVSLPLQEMNEYARATFWPAGALQAAVAGGIGLVFAVVAWIIGIPVLSGVVIVVGGFMFVMAVYTFVHEGRKVLHTRRS